MPAHHRGYHIILFGLLLAALACPADADTQSAAAAARAACHAAYADEEAGKLEQALAGYSTCLEQPALAKSDRVLALNFRGRVYRGLNRINKALADHSAAYKLDKNAAISLIMRGVTYASVGQFQFAVEDFSNALVLAPLDKVALHNRAESYFGLGDYQRAVKDYDQLVRLEPGNLALLAQRCRALALGGNGEAAISDCDQALSAYPADGLLHDSRSIALFRLGHFDLALNASKQAASLGAEPRWQILLHQGLIMARLGLHEKAWHALDQALARAPSQGVVITRLRELNLFTDIHRLPNAQEIIDRMRQD